MRDNSSDGMWNNLTGLTAPDDDPWRRVARARGVVRVPAGRPLRLEVHPPGAQDLSPLDRLPADALHSLSLWNARVRDEELSHLKSLTGLEWLDLTQNPVTDAGLSVLSHLKGLKELRLGGTLAGDETAARLAELPELRTLVVRDTALTDKGLREIARMPRLESLHLGSRRITDVGLAALSRSQSLRTLIIEDTPITDAGIRSLAGLKNLESLAFRGTLVTSRCWAELARLEKLKFLHVQEWELPGRGVEQLTGLRELKTLHVLHGIDDRGMQAIGRMTSLEHLYVQGSVTANGLAQLTVLPALEELSIAREGARGDISGTGVEQLVRCRNLKRLWLANYDLGDDGLAAIATLPLEYLALSQSDVSWNGLGALKGLQGLRTLHLDHTPTAGQPALAFLEHLPALEALELPTGEFPASEWAHLERLKNLSQLNIYAPLGTAVDDTVLPHVSALASLRHLGLVRTAITDEGMRPLGKLSDLRSLTITGRPGVGGEGLEHLSALPSLSYLSVNSRRLTASAIAEAFEKMPGLTLFESPSDRVPGPPGLIRQAAPDFALDTIDGGKFRLSEQKGKAAVIHFWRPESDAVPSDLQALHAEFGKRDVVFLSIALDEDDAALRTLLGQGGLSWPQAMTDANRRIAADYAAMPLPRFYVIDRNGVVAADVDRRSMDELRRKLREALGIVGQDR